MSKASAAGTSSASKPSGRRAESVRVGIVGLGRAGWGMIRQEINDLPQFRIVAGCDVMLERGRKLAEAHDAAAYTDFQQFLKDPNVELVVVSTRSLDHAPMAIAALRAGKHVLVEKPMALNVREADRMIAAAEKAGRHLLVRHNRRWDAPFLAARDVIKSGRIGRVYQIQLRQHGFNRRNDWQTLKRFGGGQLYNWGPHLVDWGLRLLGNEPVAEVWGDLKKVAAAGDAEDHVKILVRGEKGTLVDIEISGGVAIPHTGFLVFGTQGAIEISGRTMRIRSLDRGRLGPVKPDPKTPPEGAGFGNPETLAWNEETVEIPSSERDMFWESVFTTVRKNRTFPITLEEARQNLWVMDQARKGTGF